MIGVFLLILASPFIALGLLVIWLLTRRRSKRAKRWVWTIVALPPAALLLLTILAFASRFFSTASDHFDWIFDVAPVPGVTELTSRYDDWLDGGEVFLAFKAPQDVAAPLIARWNFGRFTGSDIPMPGGDSPDWWTLSRCTNPKVHYVEPHARWTEILLVHCPQENLVLVQARLY